MVEDGGWPGVGGMPAAMGTRGVALAAVSQFWSGRRRPDGVDARAGSVQVVAPNLVAVGCSWEIPVALRSVADQTGTKSDDPREAGRHAVAVGVAGDEMVAE